MVKKHRHRVAYSSFETEPVLQAQVDWSDFQITAPDGTTMTKFLFLIILGFSPAMHLEFDERSTLETFLDCNQRAFRYPKGVSIEILYENMKHVVVDHMGGKELYNIKILHFAHP